VFLVVFATSDAQQLHVANLGTGDINSFSNPFPFLLHYFTLCYTSNVLPQVTLLLDVYNHGCMGWEPVVEPWTLGARLESTLAGQQLPSSASQVVCLALPPLLTTANQQRLAGPRRLLQLSLRRAAPACSGASCTSALPAVQQGAWRVLKADCSQRKPASPRLSQSFDSTLDSVTLFSQAGHHELAVTAERVLEVTASLPSADALALSRDILSGDAATLLLLILKIKPTKQRRGSGPGPRHPVRCEAVAATEQP